MGNGRKERTKSEEMNMEAARKSIVAARPIQEGEILSEDHLAVKRPGGGISPMEWLNIIGSKARRSFAEDELIEI